jgi:hypothetical protein
MALVLVVSIGYKVSKKIQETKETDILEKIAKKYPGSIILTTIGTNPGAMTKVQITSYQEGLVGKTCVGMGRVVDIKKTTGSAVLDFFGVNTPGTVIKITHERYDVKLVLATSYSDEFLAYNVGDTVIFAGTIAKVIMADRTAIDINDVIIERHIK